MDLMYNHYHSYSSLTPSLPHYYYMRIQHYMIMYIIHLLLSQLQFCSLNLPLQAHHIHLLLLNHMLYFQPRYNTYYFLLSYNYHFYMTTDMRLMLQQYPIHIANPYLMMVLLQKPQYYLMVHHLYTLHLIHHSLQEHYNLHIHKDLHQSNLHHYMSILSYNYYMNMTNSYYTIHILNYVLSPLHLDITHTMLLQEVDIHRLNHFHKDTYIHSLLTHS